MCGFLLNAAQHTVMGAVGRWLVTATEQDIADVAAVLLTRYPESSQRAQMQHTLADLQRRVSRAPEAS